MFNLLIGILKLDMVFRVLLLGSGVALLAGMFTLASETQIGGAGLIEGQISSTTQNASANVTGIVAAYGFNEATGTITADASGNNNKAL